MDNLPLELIEKVLLKSFTMMHASVSKSEPYHPNASQPEAITYANLSSVCATWRRISTRRRWFKEALSNQLASLGSG